jgi:hypothetical protein
LARLYEEQPPATSPVINGWTTNQQKAEGFNRVFAEKHRVRGTVPGAIPVPAALPAGLVEIGASPQEVPAVSAAEIAWAIKRSPRKASVDAGGISARLLHELPQESHQLLADLMTAMLRLGVVPPAWRSSVFVPLLKPGKSESEASSYRPVAITRVMCRLMERVLLKRIAPSVVHMFGAHQYGFRQQRDPVMGLIDAVLSAKHSTAQEYHQRGEGRSRAYGARTRSGQTLLMAMDLSDAFCSVPIGLVIQRLQASGLESVYVRWIHEFLTDRVACTRVGNARSSYAPTPSGTPQGAVLSPLLWCIAISEMEQFMKQETDTIAAIRRNSSACSYKQLVWAGWSFFADDLTIWICGYDMGFNDFATNHWHDAAERLLLRAAEWFMARGIEVSPKSAGIRIHGANAVESAARRPASVLPEANVAFRDHTRWENSASPAVDARGRQSLVDMRTVVVSTSAGELRWTPHFGTDPIRVLGVLVDERLAFEPHVRATTAKVEKSLSIIGRVRYALPPLCLSALVDGWVTSVLMYGTEAWWGCSYVAPRRTMKTCFATAIKMVTGVFRTAKTNGALLEAGSFSLQRKVELLARKRAEQLTRLPHVPAARWVINQEQQQQQSRRRPPASSQGTAASSATPAARRSQAAAGNIRRLDVEDEEDPDLTVSRAETIRIGEAEAKRANLRHIAIEIAGRFVRRQALLEPRARDENERQQVRDLFTRLGHSSKLAFVRPAQSLTGPVGEMQAATPEEKAQYNRDTIAAHRAGPGGIEAWTDGSVIPASDEAGGRSASAGVAQIWRHDGTVAVSKQQYAGEHACSYTAENVGLRLAAHALVDFKRDGGRETAAVIFTDSLSNILAQECNGRLMQTDMDDEMLSEALLRVAEVFDRVKVVFVYAHVSETAAAAAAAAAGAGAAAGDAIGESVPSSAPREATAEPGLPAVSNNRNVVVDELARRAAERYAAQHPPPEEPEVSFRDGARVVRKGTITEAKAEMISDQGYRGTLTDPPPAVSRLRIRSGWTTAHHRTLHQMRLGQCWRIGGWMHSPPDGVPPPCRFCGQHGVAVAPSTANGHSSMTTHILRCRGALPVQQRLAIFHSEAAIEKEALFGDDATCKRAADYVLSLGRVGGTTHGDSDLDDDPATGPTESQQQHRPTAR